MPDAVRGSQSAQTRARLLEAAIVVVAERGWVGATSRTLAAQAGVNLALINYHFRSKDRLLLAALDHAMARLEPLGGAPMDLDGLHEAACAMVTGLAEAPEVCMLLEALLHARHEPMLAKALAGHLRAFRSFATACVARSGGRSRPNARDKGLGVALAAALDGLLLHMWVDSELDVRAALDALFSRLDASGG